MVDTYDETILRNRVAIGLIKYILLSFLSIYGYTEFQTCRMLAKR